MNDNVRKRGWSVTSDTQTDTTDTASSQRPPLRRGRSNTDHSEDTLTAAEKMEILNDFPSQDLDDDDEEEEEEDMMKLDNDSHDVKPKNGENGENHKEIISLCDDDDNHDDDSSSNSEEDEIEMFRLDEEENNNDKDKPSPPAKRQKLDTSCDKEKNDNNDDKNNDDSSSNSEEDEIEMFGNEDDEENNDNGKPPPAKRQKLDPSCDKEKNDNDGDDTTTKTTNPKIVELAKQRLSKWAARLFDPNRPRGLVETPEVIPLNDEFLEDFGKREKELDKLTGRIVDIDNGNLDEAANDDDNDDEKKKDADDDMELLKGNTKKEKSDHDGFKIRITNLAFATSKRVITDKCEKYGVLTMVDLPMDPTNSKLSKGRAFIKFESKHDALECVKGMHEKILGGRQIFVHFMGIDNNGKDGNNKNNNGNNANGNKRGGRGGGGGGGKTGSNARYYIKDITTKCFRCGQVGHMADSCPNDEVVKPCPLCAQVGHDSWTCPLAKICFNCGVPGHINRECPERSNMPKRMVCGKCFMSGHHRWQCREQTRNIPTYNAKCMICYRNCGQFMCKPMRWFFGLKGLTCCNCGQSGHHGAECKRPTLDHCARNQDLALGEIEKAEALKLELELESQERRSRGRERSRDDDYNRRRDRSRHRDRDRDRDYSDDRYSDRRGGGGRAKSQPPDSYFNPNSNQNSTYGRIERGRERDGRSRDYHDRSRERSRSRYDSRSDRRGYR